MTNAPSVTTSVPIAATSASVPPDITTSSAYSSLSATRTPPVAVTAPSRVLTIATRAATKTRTLFATKTARINRPTSSSSGMIRPSITTTCPAASAKLRKATAMASRLALRYSMAARIDWSKVIANPPDTCEKSAATNAMVAAISESRSFSPPPNVSNVTRASSSNAERTIAVCPDTVSVIVS